MNKEDKLKGICKHCLNDDPYMLEILSKIHVNEWYNCVILCQVCSKTYMTGPFKDEN